MMRNVRSIFTVVGLLAFTAIILYCAADVNSLGGRQFKGFWERLAHPGLGSCGRCARSWGVVDGHTTWLASDHGVFPLCEHCWGELSPKARLPFYRELWDSHDHGVGVLGGHLTWKDWERAVLEE